MVKQLAVILTVLIIYLAYRPIVVPYMADLSWLYHMLFLFVFLCYLSTLGFAVYYNVEPLAALLSEKQVGSSPPAGIIKCVNCGEEVSGGSLFCPSCGMELPQPKKCSDCGQLLKAGTNFCAFCGKPVEEPEELPEIAEKEKGVQDTEGVTACSVCGTGLKPGAMFCSQCGGKV